MVGIPIFIIMDFNFDLISSIVTNFVGYITTLRGYLGDEGGWCGIAIFIFFLWLIDFVLHMWRIGECKKLKKKVKELKKKIKNDSENKASKKV